MLVNDESVVSGALAGGELYFGSQIEDLDRGDWYSQPKVASFIELGKDDENVGVSVENPSPFGSYLFASL